MSILTNPLETLIAALFYDLSPDKEIEEEVTRQQFLIQNQEYVDSNPNESEHRVSGGDLNPKTSPDS
ncbi:hypothetical protein [Brasilonema sp. UFV-L1]|uniref:hypothetical protein n=1 Tax=Brasilonema sp. UFV-L1 TaxID=2234130 RepID=UPI00145DD80B|nr:hypothetical protein [Brasilonema sp. UFV-L1]NMG08817.1 hypothetical protein [Brasilonema sp. UFV-L1]